MLQERALSVRDHHGLSRSQLLKQNWQYMEVVVACFVSVLQSRALGLCADFQTSDVEGAHHAIRK